MFLVKKFNDEFNLFWDMTLMAARRIPEKMFCGRGRPKSLSQSVLVKHRVIVGNSQTNGSQNASRQRQKAFCDGIYIERCSYDGDQNNDCL